MGKRFKSIKPKAKYIIPLVAMTSLLGVSYGYWSDSLQVNADVSTGKLMVQGREIYPQQGNNLPIHRQDGHDCYMEGICGFRNFEEESTTLQYGVILSEFNKCNKIMHWNCKCNYDVEVEFQVVNTGNTDAYIRLNQSPAGGYEQTWFRTIKARSDSPEWDAERAGKGFKNSIKIDKVIRTNGTEEPVGELLINERGYKLKVGEAAKCSFKIKGIPKDKVNEDWYYEAQIGIQFSTGENGKGWIGNTCNNVFIKPRISKTMTKATLFEVEQIENEIMLLPSLDVQNPLPELSEPDIAVPLPLPEPSEPDILVPLPLPGPTNPDIPLPLPEPTEPSTGEVPGEVIIPIIPESETPSVSKSESPVGDSQVTESPSTTEEVTIQEEPTPQGGKN